MFLDIILIIIIVISILTIISVIFKKIPQLNRVNPEESNDYQDKLKKEEIIEKKIKKDLEKSMHKFYKIIKPLSYQIYKYLKKTYNYLYSLEEKYRKRLIKAHFEDKISSESKIKTSLEKAEKFIQDKEFNQAENEYINALKLDMHNLNIYQKLADLYLDTKDYNKAQETFGYIIKLQENDYAYNKLGDIFINRGDLNQAIFNYQKAIKLKDNKPSYYYNLSKAYIKSNKLEDSLENIKKALNIEPDNPNLLDFLIDLSIIMGDKELAEKTLNKLTEVNPENKRISEIREKIKQI